MGVSEGATSGAWVHDLDPVLVDLGPVPVRFYGLAYAVGFLLGWLLIRRVLSRGRSPLGPEAASDLVVALMLGVLIGARLGYAVFYRPSLLWTFTSDLPFWELLAIHEGGMASHGGMIGVVVAALLWAHKRQVPFLHVMDLAAFAAPLGLFFGRLANFINGELYGRPAPDDLPWAMKFPSEMYTWGEDRLRALGDALPGSFGLAPSPLEVRQQLPALIDAIQQDNAEVTEAAARLLVARHPSQLYEAGLEGLVVFAVLAFAWRNPRRPGIVAALFAMTYAAARIVAELFREPDAHLRGLEFTWLHVTRGQWLSVLLFLAGFALLLVSRRRGSEPMGGWREP